MFGTLFKRIYKGQTASLVPVVASAVRGSEISIFPDAAANDTVTLSAVNELAQQVSQVSRTVK
jgi:hypothetical protein